MIKQKQHITFYNYFAVAVVFIAVAGMLSKDAFSWLHILSHHTEHSHQHHNHHHCGETTEAHDAERCKPESCEHDGHIAAEVEPCFWCSLPLSSFNGADVSPSAIPALFKSELAFIISKSFFYSELKNPAANRGPPYHVLFYKTL